MRSRWPLLALLCVLASLLDPGVASASAATGVESRVWAFDLADQVHVAGQRALTPELHQSYEFADYDCASGSLLAAKNVLDGLPGKIGKTGPIKEVPDAKALDDLFDSLSSGGKVVDPGTYPGVVKKLPDGTIIRRRPGSKSGGATLDITMPDGTIIKVHHK